MNGMQPLCSGAMRKSPSAASRRLHWSFGGVTCLGAIAPAGDGDDLKDKDRRRFAKMQSHLASDFIILDDGKRPLFSDNVTGDRVVPVVRARLWREDS